MFLKIKRASIITVIAAILIFGVSFSQRNANALEIDTEAGMKSFMENILLRGLPGPAGEVVSVIQNSPEIFKHGLRGWLKSEMRDALYAENIDKFEKYLAFYDCISNKNCSDIRKILSAEENENTPPSLAQETEDEPEGKFKIYEAFVPKTVRSGGRKGSLTVFWGGNPRFPVTMVYRPTTNGCPKGVNCSIPRKTFSNESDPLIFKDSVWCRGASKNHYFGYEVILRDADGIESAPKPAAFTCKMTGK